MVMAELSPLFGDDHAMRDTFAHRLEGEYERIFRIAHELYGWRWDFSWHLMRLLREAAEASVRRKKWLRRRDALDAGASWLTDPASVWAMGYLDRFVGDVAGLERALPHLRDLGVTGLHLMPPYAVPDGPNDGGYAVSDYRSLRPDLGTIEGLSKAAKKLDGSGIGLVLDFVANHTAHDHSWAQSAREGVIPFDRFYLMFDDRESVDEWLPHLREIFPDRGGDAFSWRPDVRGPNGGKWVWTTFYPYQWDLDYRQPEVLVAMAAELLSVANIGPAVIRMDATPFLWKQQGTSCENLPEAHLILQLLNAIVVVVAPSIRFLSEAIVHPDDVLRFIRADECALGYNPILMSVIWEAVATGDTALLAEVLARRSTLPDGCQWISYLRSHDDIGWGFADEDAWAHGIDPNGHRAFLNAFYCGEFPGSFATGARFQENPRTGDARISGTMASLAGLERALATASPIEIDLAVDRIIAMETVVFTTVGIPMIFMGDQIATCNDHRYAEDPEHADDNRWMHRPHFDWAALDRARSDPTSPAGRVLAAIRRLVEVRSRIPGFGNAPGVVAAGDPGLIAYRHRAGARVAQIVVNLTDRTIAAAFDHEGLDWSDAYTGQPVELSRPLGPYEVVISLADADDRHSGAMAG